MHPNPTFRGEATSRSIEFAAERGFGTLMANGAHLPLVAHIPFTLPADTGHALLHLMRSNPLARACTAAMPARLSVMGPDSYVSPDWYGIEDQVPTWNYVAVHLEGTLEPLPHTALREVLDSLSTEFEDRLLPKPPWRAEKLSPDVRERMMRMIRPFRFAISAVESTWKLGQNKSGSARQAAAMELHASGIGSEARLLAALMLGA